jgi:CMP/dCMP kinase
LNREDAQNRIQLKDQDRVRYLQAQYHRHPADPCLYDIVLNTSVLDLDSAVDLLALALERKARRLTTPPEELGPAAGMPRYPEQPEDFHSTTNMGEQLRS